MKVDAVLFLQRSDVPHFCANAASWEQVPRIFLDPGVMEDALLAGLDSALFDFRRLAVGPTFQARVTAEAMSRALAIDVALTREREALFGPGVYPGWDHALLRLFMNRALTARLLGEVCSAEFEGRTIGLLRPDRPQLYYFDSFLTTELFAAGRPQWRIVDTYTATRNWVETLGACFDFERIRAQAGTAQAVTHIPTCYADGARYIADIVERFAGNIDLPSPMWDIPVRRGAAPLSLGLDAAELRHPAEFALASVYRERARAVLERHFADLPLGAEARAVQVAHLADRCRLQALNFLGLREALRGTRPHFVLADQDTGSNGPLFSVAAELGSAITVLPHSSVPTTLIPHAHRVACVERDGFRTRVRGTWGERIAVRAVNLGARAPVARSAIRTVCLLLNTMCSEGLSYVDFFGLVDFHEKLAQLCAGAGVELMVRIKPGSGAPHVVSGLLGVAREHLDAVLRTPIDEVAARADLCVSYGEPTTACIRFLEAGSLTLNVNEQSWPSDYLSTPALIADGVVPALPGEQALPLVAAMLADPAPYQQVQRAQQQEFTGRLGAGDRRLFEPAPTKPAAARANPAAQAASGVAHAS